MQQKLASSSLGRAFEVEIEKMGEYVAKEFKKVKISLSMFELIKVPTIRHAFFQVINETPSSKSTQKYLPKESLSKSHTMNP